MLLGWVFHNIFLEEGRQAWERQGGKWEALAPDRQRHVAWTRGPEELWRALCQVRAGPGVASLVFMGLTIGIGALRWRMMMCAQGLALPLTRAAEISLVAHFFNSFLLGATGGDLMKAYYAARETHHLKIEAVVAVLIDRFIGLVSMLAFAALMMLPNLLLLTVHKRLAGLAVVTLLLLAAGLTAAVLSFRGGVSRRWPRARDWLRRLPKGDVLDRSLEACRRLGRDRTRLARACGLSMALSVACVLQIWALGLGLDLNIDPVALFAIVPVIIVISGLPVTPNGLGVRENLYVWLLAVPEIGVGATQALSLSLLSYAGNLVWSILGGAIYVTFKRRHHLAEVVQVDAPAAF